MQNLAIDTGVQEFSVNGRGVLRFNPGDPNLYHRFFAARAELNAMDEALARDMAALDSGDAQAPQEARAADALCLLAGYDGKLKALLTRVFGPENDFNILLDGVNLAGTGSNGKRVVQNLLEALAPILQAGARGALQQRTKAAVAEAEAARAARGQGA